MSELVTTGVDFALTRGNGRAVTVNFYNPATDTVGSPQTGFGVRGPKDVSQEEHTPKTRTTWAISGLTLRPPMNSQVVDSLNSDVWLVVDEPQANDADTDPIDQVFNCHCVLL
jgi:hypothetical protein